MEQVTIGTGHSSFPFPFWKLHSRSYSTCADLPVFWFFWNFRKFYLALLVASYQSVLLHLSSGFVSFCFKAYLVLTLQIPSHLS